LSAKISVPSKDRLAAGGLDQPQDGAAHGGLARAALADQADGGATADVEAHIFDGVDDAAIAAGEALGEALDAEQGVSSIGWVIARGSCSSAKRYPARPGSAAGRAARQASTAIAQRGSKAQPGGRLVMGGTEPGME
jgi:hypothetical protein